MQPACKAVKVLQQHALPTPCSPRTAHPCSTPIAVKFHYQFNMRELGNVAQGLCRMTKEAYKEPLQARAGVADGTGCCAIRLPIDL